MKRNWGKNQEKGITNIPMTNMKELHYLKN